MLRLSSDDGWDRPMQRRLGRELTIYRLKIYMFELENSEPALKLLQAVQCRNHRIVSLIGANYHLQD